MVVDRVGRHTGSYIQGSTCNHKNEGKTNNLEPMSYLEYAALGVCYTWCMMYSVYAVLSVNSWSWHGEIETDDLTLCSAMMVELWTRKRHERWRWEQYGGYERIWKITRTTCLIGLERPRIGAIICRIGTHTCPIGDGKLTRTQNSLTPSSSWWFAPSLHISLVLVLNSTVT